MRDHLWMIPLAPIALAVALSMAHWHADFGTMVLAWWRLRYHRPHRLNRLLVFIDIVLAMFLGLMASILVRSA